MFHSIGATCTICTWSIGSMGWMGGGDRMPLAGLIYFHYGFIFTGEEP